MTNERRAVPSFATMSRGHHSFDADHRASAAVSATATAAAAGGGDDRCHATNLLTSRRRPAATCIVSNLGPAQLCVHALTRALTFPPVSSLPSLSYLLFSNLNLD